MPVGVVVAVVGVAATAASQAMQASAQDKAAKASANAAQANANAIAANYEAQMKIMKLQMKQDRMEELDEKMKRKMSADQVSASLMVAAGEANISGTSVKRVVNKPQTLYGIDAATLDATLRARNAQQKLQAEALAAQASNGMAQQQASVLAPANWGAVGLSIAGSVASSAARYA